MKGIHSQRWSRSMCSFRWTWTWEFAHLTNWTILSLKAPITDKNRLRQPRTSFCSHSFGQQVPTLCCMLENYRITLHSVLIMCTAVFSWHFHLENKLHIQSPSSQHHPHRNLSLFERNIKTKVSTGVHCHSHQMKPCGDAADTEVHTYITD